MQRYVAKVSDFGTSKLLFDGNGETSHLVGFTRVWAAPEVMDRYLHRTQAKARTWAGPKVGVKSDVYSAGLVLCFLFHPLVERRRSLPDGWRPSSETERIPNFDVFQPLELRDLLRRMLAHAADERPSSEEVLHALNQIWPDGD